MFPSAVMNCRRVLSDWLSKPHWAAGRANEKRDAGMVAVVAVLGGAARYCDSAMPAARITLPQRSISDLT
jgi:hypothetical protein